MSGRRAARRTALFLLYQWDVTGQPLATIYARDTAGVVAGAEALDRAIAIGAGAPAPRSLVSHRVTARGIEALAG